MKQSQPRREREDCILVVQIEPRAVNVLQPALWLNPATEYRKSFADSGLTCQQYKAGTDPVCQTFAEGGGAVQMRGAWLQAPLLYAESLQLPLRLVARIQRNQQCSNHYLVLSTRPNAPSFYGRSLLGSEQAQ